MRVGFTYFQEFDADAAADVVFAKMPLRIPVLAMGGEKSMGALMPQFAKAVAANVRTSVIPDSGHWLMDENPGATIAALSAFFQRKITRIRPRQPGIAPLPRTLQRSRADFHAVAR